MLSHKAGNRCAGGNLGQVLPHCTERQAGGSGIDGALWARHGFGPEAFWSRGRRVGNKNSGDVS
jgi:hypothetical protein